MMKIEIAYLGTERTEKTATKLRPRIKVLIEWRHNPSIQHQKLFCYHLPTRERVGIKLGDVDTCQT